MRVVNTLATVIKLQGMISALHRVIGLQAPQMQRRVAMRTDIQQRPYSAVAVAKQHERLTKHGSRFELPAGQILRPHRHIPGIPKITHENSLARIKEARPPDRRFFAHRDCRNRSEERRVGEEWRARVTREASRI